MSALDWALLGDRGGEPLEDLIATLLRLEYPDARQVNPSQGDGGVDVIRETAEGIEVWQVKKFTGPLNASQMRQVKMSWNRFWTTHVAPATPKTIFRYHLVTPWTPTEEKLADFAGITGEAEFPVQWDGAAFIDGLADKHPATILRFERGIEGAFRSFVTERSLLAGSPVERTADISMVEAINARQDALDELRATLSDNYLIDVSTRTTRGEEPPMPTATDPGVFHRMTYLSENRWRTESVVPRHADASAIDPIHLDVEFLEHEGSDGYQAIRDWEQWGIPFDNVHARTTTRGGPFGGETHEASLSFWQNPDNPPPLFYVVRDASGAVRFRMPLVVRARTQGVRTGWLRLVVETPQKVLHLEMRSKGTGPEPSFVGTMGDVRGLDPGLVLHEIEQLQSVKESDTFALELTNGLKLLSGGGFGLPSAMSEYFEPIARGLVSLQASTTETLLMPDVMAVTVGQFRKFAELVSIYDGEPHVWTWERLSWTAPDTAAHMPAFREEMRKLIEGAHMPVVIERPEIHLADACFQIERPIVTTRSSFRLDPDVEIARIRPGDLGTIVPADDNRATTAAVVDWTPGSTDRLA